MVGHASEPAAERSADADDIRWPAVDLWWRFLRRLIVEYFFTRATRDIPARILSPSILLGDPSLLTWPQFIFFLQHDSPAANTFGRRWSTVENRQAVGQATATLVMGQCIDFSRDIDISCPRRYRYRYRIVSSVTIATILIYPTNKRWKTIIQIMRQNEYRKHSISSVCCFTDRSLQCCSDSICDTFSNERLLSKIYTITSDRWSNSSV